LEGLAIEDVGILYGHSVYFMAIRYILRPFGRFYGYVLDIFFPVLIKYIFVANAFNTQTMHIRSFYTQQHCYVSLKTLYPGEI
jgi:hypothetical protein